MNFELFKQPVSSIQCHMHLNRICFAHFLNVYMCTFSSIFCQVGVNRSILYYLAIVYFVHRMSKVVILCFDRKDRIFFIPNSNSALARELGKGAEFGRCLTVILRFWTLKDIRSLNLFQKSLLLANTMRCVPISYEIPNPKTSNLLNMTALCISICRRMTVLL